MEIDHLKPIQRSRLRMALGRIYYRSKRTLEWHFSGKKYAKYKEEHPYPAMIFQHRTPLLRELKSVDMWMQYNKIENLKIAIRCLDGIILRPGETLSYWRLIGKPTKRKGYKEGMVLYYGGFKAGIGGGLCQLSNLIYWMTLHTPLRVIEKYRHSYDVFPDANRTQPFGSGATCVYNYRDLQIYNGTDTPYQLKLTISGAYLYGEWRSLGEPDRSYEVYESRHWISHEYWGGYARHNEIRRRVYNRDNSLIDDEYITENHALMMYQPFLSDI